MARVLEIVNAVNYSAKSRVTKIRLHEDLIYIYLTTDDGQTFRALLDTGATVSGIAERLLENPKTSEWINKCENKARLHERDIIYANSEKGQTGRTFENVTFGKSGGGETSVPTLYGMPLPAGIDILLGLDWFRRENPDINWQTGEAK